MLWRLGSVCTSTLLMCALRTPIWPSDAEQRPQPKVSIAVRAPSAKVTRSSIDLRVDVKVVLVPVTVTDTADRPMTTLSQDNFRIVEDGVEQKITSFAYEDGPVSLGLLFDSSGSMKNRIAVSVTALKHFFQTTIPGDEFLLVQFNDQPHVLGGFTTEPEEIYRRLGFVQATGWTALLDAVALSAHEMKSARNTRKLLLILSDGNDNNSRFNESEVRNMVVEGDFRVYAIALSYRPRLLQRLADETGGRVLIVKNMSELPDVVGRLSAEIRSQYVLGYSPNNPNRDGKYRQVRIHLVQPPNGPSLRASWRRGYYAPD